MAQIRSVAMNKGLLSCTLLLVISMHSLVAFSFNVQGFRDGMTKETVRQTILESGLLTAEWQDEKYTARPRDGSMAGVLSFYFCKDRLFRVIRASPVYPDFDNLAKMLQDRISRLGQPAFVDSNPESSVVISFAWRSEKRETTMLQILKLPTRGFVELYEVESPCARTTLN